MNCEWRRNNVRELRNIIERMVISSDGEEIGPGDVPAEVNEGHAAAPVPDTGTFQELKSEAERQIIIAALERGDWQITRTAADLGLADHASLLKIMRRHDIKKK
jgi:transcriptional regulator of acetoin/glycerol metabolism